MLLFFRGQCRKQDPSLFQISRSAVTSIGHMTSKMISLYVYWMQIWKIAVYIFLTVNNFKHSIESWGDLNWTMKAFECSKSATWNDPLLGYFHFTIEIDIKIMTQTELNEVKVPLFKPARIDTDYCFSTVNEITFFINCYYDLKKRNPCEWIYFRFFGSNVLFLGPSLFDF